MTELNIPLKIDSLTAINYIFKSGLSDSKLISSSRKNRKFDLQNRLGKYSYNKQPGDRIKFERLPRKRVKSFAWTLAVFIIVLYLFFYLNNI